MHRSPLVMLVTIAALAACSARDDSTTTAVLKQDPALVAHLELDQESRTPTLPAECGTTTVAARPAAANTSQARALARQAYEAETLGEVADARSLLRRAAELDGTDWTAAYHLGRLDEALGDRAGALAAYCRVLALAPSAAESADARQRVAGLPQPAPRVATGSVGDVAPARRRATAATATRVTRATRKRATRDRATVEPRVAVAAVAQPAPDTSPGRAASPATAPTSVAASPSSSEPASSSPAGDGAAAGSATSADATASPPDVPAAEQPSTAARTARRGPSRAQGAGIGAAAGAIIGAATGRSVKSAVIGAAAGGLLGAVVGGRALPVGRGIQP